MQVRVESKLVPLDPSFQTVVEIPDAEDGGQGIMFQTVERFNNRQVEIITVSAVYDDGVDGGV